MSTKSTTTTKYFIRFTHNAFCFFFYSSAFIAMWIQFFCRSFVGSFNLSGVLSLFLLCLFKLLNCLLTIWARRKWMNLILTFFLHFSTYKWGNKNAIIFIISTIFRSIYRGVDKIHAAFLLFLLSSLQDFWMDIPEPIAVDKYQPRLVFVNAAWTFHLLFFWECLIYA